MERDEALNEFSNADYKCVNKTGYWVHYWFRYGIAWVGDTYGFDGGTGHFRKLIEFNGNLYEESHDGNLFKVTADAYAKYQMWKVDNVLLRATNE